MKIRANAPKTRNHWIVRWFRAVFDEGNRCRFARGCELYQTESVACNNWYERFPTFEKSYCGRYRSIEDEEKK